MTVSENENIEDLSDSLIKSKSLKASIFQKSETMRSYINKRFWKISAALKVKKCLILKSIQITCELFWKMFSGNTQAKYFL